MKIAVIGASHWHVPLYEPGFAGCGAELVAVWDETAVAANELAGRHGARAYDRLERLLDTDLDFAFVFGTPAAMPDLARTVIARGLPLSLEKPCGRTASEVRAVREAASAAGVYVAVPLVQRFAPIGRRLMELAAVDPPMDLTFRFIAGPPERYERVGCGWALDRSVSGGGPMINLAVHFVDMALLLTGSPAASVFARTSDIMHRRAVEDRALLSIAHRNGALTTIEAGYRFPDAPPRREFRLSVIGRTYYAESAPDSLLVRDPAGAVVSSAVSYDTDIYYTDYVARVLEDVAGGRSPSIGLAEMEAALAIVDAGYESARTGRPIDFG